MRLRYLFLLAILFAVSCQKPEPEEDKNTDGEDTPVEDVMDFEPGSQTLMYDAEMTEYFIRVDENSFLLSSSIPDELIPSKGKIICCTVTDNTPAGFLGRITDIQANADGILVSCESVSLEEAFSKLKIKTSVNLSQYVEDIIDENGKSIEHKIVSSEILDSLSADPDAGSTIPETSPGPASVETKATFDKSACLQISLENESLKGSLYVEYTLNINIDIDMFSVKSMDAFFQGSSGFQIGEYH